MSLEEDVESNFGSEQINNITTVVDDDQLLRDNLRAYREWVTTSFPSTTWTDLEFKLLNVKPCSGKNQMKMYDWSDYWCWIWNSFDDAN